MCGIVSIFHYDADLIVDRDELLRVRDQMTRRGPDGAGEWYSKDNRVGLGHRRLAIIDLSESGTQPMQTEDGRYVISFNGEIYNYQALRSGLQASGYRFRSTSDTEVLLQLYVDKGPGMLNDLRGMFAFIIWDNLKRELFLARDPFGIKPLYYADDGRTFRVASQVKALLAGGKIDTSPEPAGHVGFFLWGHIPEPYTLYEGIRALPAGSYMCVQQSGTTGTLDFGPKVYCSIPAIMSQAGQNQIYIRREEMRFRLREAMLDTVQHHLIADVPVGVFLSSGLDSSTLAALASEISKNTLNTVTLGFREFMGSANNEVPLAEQVAKNYGTLQKTIIVEKKDFQADIDSLFDAMDQPTIDGVNSYFVSKAAKEAGLKVALSGLGGDELFGGYASFKQVPKMVKFFGPLKNIPFLGKAFRAVSAPVLKYMTSPKYAGLLEYGGTFGGAYLLRRGMFMPWELPGLLDGELVREGWNELQTLTRLEQTVDGIVSDHFRVSSLETCWYMRNQLLRDTDWASMAHSLEIRTPLVDIVLHKNIVPLLCSAYPPSKKDMAATPVSPLPPGIMKREKTGFAVPVKQWLPEGDGFKEERGLRGWAKKVYTSCQ